jgi:hypothetical protein
MASDFTPGIAIRVGYNSVIDVTGSNRPLTPADTLARYNVVDDDQILLITTNIIENNSFGLPKFERTIDPDALKDLNNGWSLRDLGDVIFDESAPANPSPAFASQRSVASVASGPAFSPVALSRLASVIQENPIAAVMISASIGVALGMLIGSSRR